MVHLVPRSGGRVANSRADIRGGERSCGGRREEGREVVFVFVDGGRQGGATFQVIVVRRRELHEPVERTQRVDQQRQADASVPRRLGHQEDHTRVLRRFPEHDIHAAVVPAEQRRRRETHARRRAAGSGRAGHRQVAGGAMHTRRHAAGGDHTCTPRHGRMGQARASGARPDNRTGRRRGALPMRQHRIDVESSRLSSRARLRDEQPGEAHGNERPSVRVSRPPDTTRLL